MFLKSLLMVVLFWGMVPLVTAATPPDWNELQIEWRDYEGGLHDAKQSGKPILLIFYADWCPTCHAYKNIFNKAPIVALAKQLVMIRVNVDKFPKLDKQFNFDGGYVPRSFALTPDSEVLHDIYMEKRYKYFIKAKDIATFELLMKKAIAGG